MVHARRLRVSQIRYAMIISTTSKGSLVAGDGPVVEDCREKPPESTVWIMARVRYQIRMTSSSIAVVVVRIEQSDCGSVVILPNSEDVGVFLGGIVISLQAGGRVLDHRGKICRRSPGRSAQKCLDYPFAGRPPRSRARRQQRTSRIAPSAPPKLTRRS